MPVLFSDPVGWSAAAVSTRTRFWFVVVVVVVLVGLQFALVYAATTGGWRGAIALAASLAWFQFMFLFALRKLYLQLARAANGSAA
jgi:hypothetical protein